MKNILLIEDNGAIQENTVELLELGGYKVITASNGKHGLELAREFLPDIILSDVMMPEMNGHKVYQELRRHEPTSRIPFVFITSSVEEKEIQDAMSKGVDGYIKKPFEEKELFDTIKRCLDIK